MAVKMVTQTVPGLQGPQESKKSAWALRRALHRTDVKYLLVTMCKVSPATSPLYSILSIYKVIALYISKYLDL